MPQTPSRSAARSGRGILALAAILLTPAVSAQTDGPGERTPIPTVTVSGSGEVRADPDEATVRLGVEVQHEDATRAQDEASRIAGAILAAVAELGVPEEAVQTSRLVLHPVYDSGPRPQQSRPREPEIVGYRASNVVSVRLEELTRVGPVIDAAVDAGANRVEGVDFQLRNDAEARSEALRRAVADARAKAEAMAGALGVELGAVLDAQEGGVHIAVPQFGGARFEAMEMAVRSAETPVAAGEITVSANVTLRYRIDGR